MVTKSFVTPTAPSLTIKLNNTKVQWKDGVKSFDLEDEDEAAQCADLEKLMAKSPNMKQLVKYVDREAAIEVALTHQKKLKSMGGGVSGRMSTADIARLSAAAILEQRDEQLAREGSTPEQIANLNEELADADLALTEKSDEIVQAKEGFIPEEKPIPVDLEKALDVPVQPESEPEQSEGKPNPLTTMLKKAADG